MPFTLFRPSRPDFIETVNLLLTFDPPTTYCSGLLGRTSLRRHVQPHGRHRPPNCSGLLGRTSLRLREQRRHGQEFVVHCSGLLGRTSLRPNIFGKHRCPWPPLFRPSRPDFIETACFGAGFVMSYNCSGLLGRTSLRQGLRRHRRRNNRRIVPAF